MSDNSDNQLSKEKKEELLSLIRQKGVRGTCPMCNNNLFVIADGYFNNVLQVDIKTVNLSGISIPSISVICSNCGFISQHALGVLGALPLEEDKENVEHK